MTKDARSYLKDDLDSLEKAIGVLKFSLKRCEEIGNKKEYSNTEIEKFEALSSRFARVCDIFIQKIFRYIDELDFEKEGTPRDRINRAEKKFLIESADEFIEARKTRNEIAHEYVPDAVTEIFHSVKKHCPFLFDTFKRVKQYCKKKYGI